MVALPVRTVVRGNPPSVDHQIDPLEFVDLLEQIQSSASTNGSLVAFRDSVAGLDTVTATAGQSACVLAADSTGGVYEYDGTSWAKVGPIPVILTESVAAQQVADIAAKFGDVDTAVTAAQSAQSAAESAAQSADAHKENWAEAISATDIIVGQVIAIDAGNNEEREYADVVAAGTYAAPDGVLVRDATGISAQIVSKRTVFSSETELKSDPRTLSDNTVVAVPSIGLALIATSGAGDYGDTNASGQKFNVVQKALRPGGIGPDYGGTTYTISSGTYTSSTGAISLTLSSTPDPAIAVGDAVRIQSAAGVGISPKLNRRYVAQSGTSGTTIVLTAETGLGDGTFSGGSLTAMTIGGYAYRRPTESMVGNFINFRNGGYNFEDDNASWMMQVMPDGVNIGSPNSLTDGPKNTLEVGGGSPGNPNDFFANAVIGRDWARTQVAPDSSLAVQKSILVGGLAAPFKTATISSASYNATTGEVTATLSANVGLAGYVNFSISGATGTGDFARINGAQVTENGTGGTTLIFKVATGLTMTITGGTVKGVPDLSGFFDGKVFGKYVGCGGATFSPSMPLEAHTSTGGPPVTSGTVQTYGIGRIKADSSSAVFDFGIDGGNGVWLVATNVSNLGIRYPVILGGGGKVAIGSTSAGASILKVSGLPSYADNASAISGGLSVGDMYQNGGAVRVVI